MYVLNLKLQSLGSVPGVQRDGVGDIDIGLFLEFAVEATEIEGDGVYGKCRVRSVE